MPSSIFKYPKSFVTAKRKQHIAVTLISAKKHAAWVKKQEAAFKKQIEEDGFSAGKLQIAIERNAKGDVKAIYAACPDVLKIHDMAKIADNIRAKLSSGVLKECSFELKASGYKTSEIEAAHIGWGLSNYVFDVYKESSNVALALLWHKGVDRARVNAHIEAACMLRNLVNIPANDLGPDEMEAAARKIAKDHKAKVSVVKGAKLEKEFPLIHTVGMASPRAPRLIEITHGKAKDPKLTIIGKGVVFDTGGLDIKPSAYMKLMKKDMGGAAHALALGHMIMALKIPVNLRVLVPCVENAVGGASFRPGDVMKSRKGLTVENTNTDAEGRLILADSLTLASEDKPDLIIDFATLTGSARAALGPDVPAMFSNSDKIRSDLQEISMREDDPLWGMPLWVPYRSTNESSIADLHNSAGTPGDLIYSALFLEKFLIEDKGKAPDWVHLDIFAWDNNGRPGRAKGGTEMGLRACLALIEERYG